MSTIRRITEMIFDNHRTNILENSLNESINYKDLPDEELIVLYNKNKDKYAYNELYARYHKLSYVIIQKNGYFAPGMSKEDLAQEGSIGLLSAIKNYKPGANKDFKQFAILAMKRNIIDAISSANAMKNSSMNKRVDIDDFSSSLGSNKNNPYTILKNKQEKSRLINYMKSKLTPWELEVMNYFLKGYSEEEIAGETGKDKKAINNAKLRARSKLRGYLDIRDSVIVSKLLEALDNDNKEELKSIYEALYK